MRTVLALTIALTVLAGCIAAPVPDTVESAGSAHADPAPAVSFKDAAGDATEPTGEEAPFFDIVSARFDGETTDSVLLSLELATLTENFPELDSLGVHRRASYSICFAPGDGAPRRCASVDVAAFEASAETMAAFTIYAVEDCNEWRVCTWEIPVTITYGSPGTITWQVPKAYATWDGAASAMAWLEAKVSWIALNPVTPISHFAYSLETPAGDQHRHTGSIADVSDVPDVMERVTAEVAFGPAPGGAVAPADATPIFVLPEGNNYGDESIFDKPELDLLEVDLAEEGSELVATFTVASFEAMPDYHFLFVLLFGSEGKEVWEIGYLRELAGGYGYAGHCISYDCAGDFAGDGAPHDMSHHSADTVEAEIEHGTPGKIRVRVPMHLFPTIEAGDVTNLHLAISMYADASAWKGKYGDEGRGDVHKMSFIDYAWGGSPHLFTAGNEPGAAGGGHGH